MKYNWLYLSSGIPKSTYFQNNLTFFVYLDLDTRYSKRVSQQGSTKINKQSE